MPIRVTSFYLPVSPSLPYILEDVYVRGGFRSVATTAARDGIAAMAKKVGMLVYCEDVDKYFRLGTDKQTWYEFTLGGAGSGSGGGVRYETTYLSNLLQAGDSVDIGIELKSATVLILDLSLDVADIKVEAFHYGDRSDQNPYTFISNIAQMKDEGLSALDGSVERTRRFSFWSTDDKSKTHQCRLTNVGVAETAVLLTIKYLTMEQ